MIRPENVAHNAGNSRVCAQDVVGGDLGVWLILWGGATGYADALWGVPGPDRKRGPAAKGGDFVDSQADEGMALMRTSSASQAGAAESEAPRSGVSEAKLREAIGARVGVDRASVWFGDEVRLFTESDCLRVIVPSAFFREWIEAHFKDDLAEVSTSLCGRAMRVVVELKSEAESARDGVIVAPSDAPKAGGERVSAVLMAPVAESSLPARRPSKRLDDFVAGASNRLALASAAEFAQSLGASFNPLVIHGGIGLGKSHLLEGIATGFRTRRPGWNVTHLTAEAFTNRFLEAMRTGTLPAFRARMRNADAMLIDDVHFLAAKRATQLEFLHTFNTLLSAGKPIALTAEQHPAGIAKLSDELTTRFAAGMLVKIESPDFETRCAIVRAKSVSRGVELPADVTQFVATHVRASIRELEGAVQSLLATATLVGARIDMNLTRQTLRELVRNPRQSISPREIERVVCQRFGCEPAALRSPSRQREVALARGLAMYLSRKHLGTTYQELGRYFGGRDHATVIAAERSIRARLDGGETVKVDGQGESLAELIATLERSLGV